MVGLLIVSLSRSLSLSVCQFWILGNTVGGNPSVLTGLSRVLTGLSGDPEFSRDYHMRLIEFATRRPVNTFFVRMLIIV